MAELGAASTAREQLAIVARFNWRLFDGGADVIATALGRWPSIARRAPGRPKAIDDDARVRGTLWRAGMPRAR